MERQEYQPVVQRYAAAAAAIGAPGVLSPVGDIPALSGLWAGMLVDLSQRSGHQMNMQFGLKVASGVVGGVGIMAGGVKTVLKVLRWLPGAGIPTAMAVNSSVNWMLTYRLGMAYSSLVSRPGYRLTDVAELVYALIGLMGNTPPPTSAQ